MKAPAHKKLPVAKAAIGFKPEYLDFARGIRVGNLEDNERITRILKLELESRYRQDFVTERWGRGVFWQWIGYLPRANRTVKPLSFSVSFGCSKFFIMVDTVCRTFKCGLQIERGYTEAPREFSQCELNSDWDWHRLTASLKPGGPMERELKRLVLRERFELFAGSWDTRSSRIARNDFTGVSQIRSKLRTAPPDGWAGFQLYYPFSENEVHDMTGLDLVESMLAVFGEVTPAMNLCMEIQLSTAPAARS